jgi:hypothetical protein
MKYYAIITECKLGDLKKNWYLHKGYPRRSKSGSCYSTFTTNPRYVRKFNSVEAAADIIKQFSPVIFDGNEKVIEIKESNGDGKVCKGCEVDKDSE